MEALTTSAAEDTPKVVDIIPQVTWGRRNKPRWSNNVAAAAMVVGCPLWMVINWVALEHHGGSLTQTIQCFTSKGLYQLGLRYLPRPSCSAFFGYALWLLWQAALYGYLPGRRCFGQRTPGGHLLDYTTNGLIAWALTHLLFLAASVLGLIDPAIIAKTWQGLLVAANTYGFVLAFMAQMKGYYAPSFIEDRKLSGHWLYDFVAGVELNPRFGAYWDFKFFHNGRPGIVAWTLIDISWAAYQRQTLGYITKSMLIVLVLQTIYVVDFFWNEDWYTRTIDISHDHFGFMLAWGDTMFLPAFYTSQVQYLARYPTHLSSVRALGLLSIGLIGYAMFRSINHQRDYIRACDGDATVWGRPAEFIRCKYWTNDGKEHESLLITSGWWGLSRHANYLADLIFSWAMCATCGFTHLLPWSYFFFMCVLLCHRASRDEKRCRNKYGAAWDEYCRRVKWRIVPGVY